LEGRRSEDDKMSRGVWEVVETKTGRIRMAKTEERGRKEVRGKRREKKRKRREEQWKNNGSKESGRGIGNLG